VRPAFDPADLVLYGADRLAGVGHRANRRLLVLGGLWIFSAMLLLLAFVTNYYLALFCLGVAGWGMLLFFSTINTLLVQPHQTRFKIPLNSTPVPSDNPVHPLTILPLTYSPNMILTMTTSPPQ